MQDPIYINSTVTGKQLKIKSEYYPPLTPLGCLFYQQLSFLLIFL